MKDLKEKTIRGGFARLGAQGASFFLRLGSLMVLARLLEPADFGLVGMVAAFTGVLNLLRDFGLSCATIQRAIVTDEQISNLFWINVFTGGALALLLVVAAPEVAAFYREPRLIAVTVVLALGFLFNAAGVQHGAVLQREMRFSALAVINTTAQALGIGVAIAGAIAGYGYWALVVMAILPPFVASIGYWIATGWVPQLPRRGVGVRSMVHFGGTLTINGLAVYIATNFEKVLLGRYWGADAIGIYGRAYQLVNLPTSNLNDAAGEVAFSALSRVQDDPGRLRHYFLKGYTLILGLTVPITVLSVLFANDIILVCLGPKWNAAAPILRLLAPIIFVFALANPLSWLLMSLGLVKRSLRMTLVISPILIAGFVIGLPYGPKGVALAYSTVMLLWVLPLIAWAVHGTAVSFQDIVSTAYKPLASGVVAGALAFAGQVAYGQMFSPFPRLILESTVLLGVFALVLLFVAGQKTIYLDLLRSLTRGKPQEQESLVSN
jgi:O-antigen/teichoic acid export membrane protein